MHALMVKKEFIASHYLIGGDWGEENQLHNHYYILELIITGKTLDQHNYLIDIVKIEKLLDNTINNYKDQILNDKKEFQDQNPSIELFSKILCLKIRENITEKNIKNIELKLWENSDAWASYSIDLI